MKYITMTTVSVIIPTYNRAKVLPRAVNSVLAQTYEDFELIIVDDASTDETQNVIEKFNDERINYFCFSTNQGANTARNYGIKKAKGELISFLDSDDEYLPRRLEVTVGRIKEAPESVGGVFHAYKYVDKDKVVNKSTAPEGIVDLTDLTEENIIGGLSCTMFRLRTLNQVDGLDESLPSSQDYDLFLRVLDKCSLIGIPKVLSRYHIDEEGIRNDFQAICEGQDRLMNKHKKILSDKRVSRHHYSRAFHHMSEGEVSDAREELIIAISMYPRDPLYIYHYLSTIGGQPTFDMANKIKKRIKMIFV